MKAKNARRAFLMSVVSLVMCVSMLVGTTFAWFTDSVTSASNKIQAGNLQIDLELLEKQEDGTTEWTSIKESEAPIFNYSLWEPGYTDVKVLKVENEGSLALKWMATFISDVELSDLANVIDVYVLPSESELAYPANRNLEGYTHVGTVADFVNTIESTTTGSLLPKDKDGNVAYLGIALKMQESAGNEYMLMELGEFDIQILATQYTYESDSFDELYDVNAEYDKSADTWDGTADTSWYDPANPQTEYSLSTAEQIAGLAELVSGDTTFKGVTITLTEDIDLYCEDTTASADGDPLTFRPIGDHSKNGTFEGTFDGNGKTISNLYQNGWDLGYEWGAYGTYGLFGNINDATIKNLTITGAESYIEGGDVGGITGSATGTCVFENITITDSDFATYNNGNGGIIGWSGAGDYTFKNITISEDVTLAGLWGSFDSSIGGIVGQGEPGATYNFENVDIACRLDVYNDCTASYDYYNYRMCGMIIGRLEETTTIDGTNYPDVTKYNINCNNVTVTYGDWANYHYCDPTPSEMNGGRGMRVEAGYSYDGIPADFDHSGCTKHCQELIAFDQVFGGAQYGVTGLPAYDGVTVVYNNK